MSLAQSLLPEFDHEMPGVRKVLERLPEDRFDWAPHPKSFTLKSLASHLATIPDYIVEIFKSESFDYAPPGGEPSRPPQMNTRAEMLDMFDRGVAEARASLAAASDEALMQPWSFLAGGKPIFTMPRVAVLRTMVMNHLIHHRGQMTVYLRLCDVPVPALYGPSADEQ